MRGHRGVEYEPEDVRTWAYPADALIGASGPPAAPLTACLWPIPDQGPTESCVGHAIAQAVYARQGAMGLAPARRIMPSPRDVYYRARASRHGWQGVSDVGSNPIAAWEVLRPPAHLRPGLGVVPISVLPWDARKVDEPYVSATRVARDHDWLTYHWILSSSEQRGEELDALLRSGRPVTAALRVNASLTRWRPEEGPWRLQGDATGGHYVCIVRVDDAGDYWAAGSYGTRYGVNGLHWIARDEVLDARTSYLATPSIDATRLG